VFNIVKGSRRPKLIKITFSLPADKLTGIHENAAACSINVRYQNGEALCVTASAEKTFTLDRAAERAWDENVRKFFRKNKIAFTEEEN
jgi:hypothetical protein